MFKHILVPTDGGKLSLKALDVAADLANATNARVSVLYVSPSYPTMVGGDGYMIAPITQKKLGYFDRQGHRARARTG